MAAAMLLVASAPIALGAATDAAGAAERADVPPPTTTTTITPTTTTAPAPAVPGALGVLEAALLAIPDSAASGAPVLWSGRAVAPDGTPAIGWVSATARPSALEGAAATGRSALPVARAQIGTDGSFELRVPMSPALAALAEDGGWTTFQLFVNSDQGVTMATDSYRFVDGRWSTTPVPEATIAAAPSVAASKPAAAPASDAADEVDHPSTLTVQPLPTAPRSRTARVGPIAPPPPGLCDYSGTYADLGGYYTGVAELNLNDSWGGRVVYRNTASTSITVGYSATASAFSAGGSITRSKYNSAQQSIPVSGSGRSEVRAQLAWYRFKWNCYVGAGQYSPQYTLEFQDWLGGVTTPKAGSAPACDDRFRSNVNVGATYTRASGSSESFTSTAGVAANFHPGIKTTFSVSAGSQSGSDIELSFTNNGSKNRDICGATDFPNRNSRIVAVK